MTHFPQVGIRRLAFALSLFPFALFLSTCTSKMAETPPPPPPSPAVGTYSPEEARQRALSLAREAFARGEREAAREFLARLLRGYPASPEAGEALFLLGKAAFESRRYEEAIRHFTALRTRFPLSPRFHESEYYLGLAHHARGKFQEAWLFLRQALSRAREPAQAARLEAALGDLYLRRKDPWGAFQAYASALRHRSDAPWAARVREALRRLARRELSEGELTRAAERFGRGEVAALARWELARRAKAAGRTKEARERLEHFIKDFPRHERAWEARAILRELKEELVADPRKIGVLLPLSGPGAEAGKRLSRGIELALRASAEIVERLGLRLVIRDTQGTPRSPGRAAGAAEELVGREKVIALLGPFFSTPTRAAISVADRHRVPLLTPFAIDGDIPQISPWAFRNSLTNRQQAAAVAGYAMERLGLRRFAILHPNGRQGVELRDHFRQVVEAGGGRVLVQVAYPVGASDFGRQIRKLGGMDDDEVKRRESRLPSPAPGEPSPRIPQIPYEAVFIPGSSEPAALIAPQLLFYNITGVRLLGARGWNSAKLVRYGEKYVEGAIFVDGFFAQSPLPPVRRFVKEFRQAFGSEPDIISALAYDGLGMLLRVLSRGARTRSEVRNGLLRIQNLPGVTGRTSMGADGDAQKELFILTVRRGRIVQLDMGPSASAPRVREPGPS